MTPVFEDEELPIATSEIDEKADIWEASIYLYMDQEEDVRERFAALLKPAFPELAIEKGSDPRCRLDREIARWTEAGAGRAFRRAWIA